MGKYLILWEADERRIPDDPETRKGGWLDSAASTRQDLQDGKLKDWGVFAGETRGYEVFEGTAEELNRISLKYIPFFRLKAYRVLSLDECEEGIKSIK